MPKRTLAAAVLAAVMAFGGGVTASAEQSTGGAPSAAPKAKTKTRAKAKASDEGSPVRVPRELRAIAECESGGDPTAISSDGTYRGKYQFSRPTWRSVGGTGDPAAATESEQDRRAVKLYRAEGTAPWPNCA